MNPTPTCGHPARLLLPWAATGRLEGDDVLQVQEHLASCADCRAELEAERRLVEQLTADDNVEYAPAASLQKFMKRLDQAQAGTPSPAARAAPRPGAASSVLSGRRWFGLQPMVVAFTAMQTAAIVLLGILVARPLVPASYTTLAEPAPMPSRPALRVMFAADLAVGELPALLRPVGAEITAGPSDSGVYTLVLDPGRSSAQALAALRGDARIRFAEPVPDAGTAARP